MRDHAAPIWNTKGSIAIACEHRTLKNTRSKRSQYQARNKECSQDCQLFHSSIDIHSNSENAMSHTRCIDRCIQHQFEPWNPRCANSSPNRFYSTGILQIRCLLKRTGGTCQSVKLTCSWLHSGIELSEAVTRTLVIQWIKASSSEMLLNALIDLIQWGNDYCW